MNAYRPSPRPAFDRATALRRAEVTRHVWGDTESGEVLDWIYVSSSLIHQIVFGLPVGSSFRHSDAFRTIFAADEVLHVLSGTMILSNPDTPGPRSCSPTSGSPMTRCSDDSPRTS